MAKNWWGFEMPEAWLKTQEVLKNMTPVISGLNLDKSCFAWQHDISGATAALRAIQPHLSGISAATETAAMLSGLSELQTSLSRIIPDYSNLFISVERIIPQIPKIPTFNWGWMSSVLQEQEGEYDEEEARSIITPEIQEELDESVRQVLVETQTNEAVKAKFVQWQEKHPLLAIVFLNIILTILVNLFSNFAYDWISAKLGKTSNVYEEPKASSSVVINVNVESEIIIIDSVPYYYQIVYTDPETGEEFRGYISKKNVDKESIETNNESELESKNDTQ